MRYPVILLSFIAAVLAPGFGADFSFTGAFAHDDERREFTLTLTQPGTVLMRTFSYAGGVNSTGARIQPGGFDPSLALFDSTGLLIAVNRDGGCGKVGADPVTATCWDALVASPLPKGTYQLVLTEADNTPQGPYLADPFVYDGAADFTAAPGANASPGFWDLSLYRRNNSYAVDITGADFAQVTPTLEVSGLVNGASWKPGPIGPNTILTLFYRSLPGAQPLGIDIDGEGVEILYNGPGQVNFVVPSTAMPKTSGLLQISSGGSLLPETPLEIEDASPALFTVDQSGSGQASVLNQDYTPNGIAAPAARGSILMVYGTGFGVANAPGKDNLSWLAAAVSATIGAIPAEVTFAGLAPGYTRGLQQINVKIPEECPTGPAVALRLQVGGHSTQLGTSIAVR